MTVLVPEFLPVNTYVAARLRRVFETAPIQEGIYDVGDLKVTQRAAGANKSVDVAVGRAWVRGDDTARQGSYHCENDGVVNLTIPDNASGNPRIDQIILRLYDSSVIGGGTNAAVLEVLQGTPTATATVDNRLGAAALPASAIRLCDIPVASGFTSITTAIVRDRRPWARGFHFGTFASVGADYSSSAAIGAATYLDSTNLRPRVECSGMPLKVLISGTGRNSAASSGVEFDINVDGTNQNRRKLIGLGSYPASAGVPFTLGWTLTGLAAGSHQIAVTWGASGGTASVLAASPYRVEFEVREDVRQNTSND